jgi:ferredoxin-NADP reductase
MAPPRPAWHPVVVAEVVQETPRDRTFLFPIPAGAEESFRFRPGQFITLRDPSWDERTQRAYSISTSPNQRESLGITVRDMGRTGEHVYHLAAGTRLQMIPPRGAFVLDVPPDDALVLLGGGSGVAPYRGFVRYLRETGATGPVVVVSSAREPSELVFDGEFRRTAEESPWFRYVPTVTRAAEGSAWSGRRGRVDIDLLRSVLADPQRSVVYACGPNAFVDAMTALCASLGVSKVRREKWG